VSESLPYWIFGMLLSFALTAAVGTPLVREHGRKLVPWLAVFTVLLGLVLGYAIASYIAYVRASATMHP
jgi:NhaP-type Na+/H+ or K+/H+ antiporter